MTLRVKDLDEAMRVARAMCERHPDLVKTVGITNSARDAALKIFLHEVAHENANAASFNVSAIEAGDGSVRRLAERTPSAVGDNSPNAASPTPHRQRSASATSGQSSPDVIGVNPNAKPDANGRICAYCREPSTRYCKETGRRHESEKERAVRMWKHIYRQMHVASNFISTARLEKPNSCLEDYAVDLDL